MLSALWGRRGATRQTQILHYSGRSPCTHRWDVQLLHRRARPYPVRSDSLFTLVTPRNISLWPRHAEPDSWPRTQAGLRRSRVSTMEGRCPARGCSCHRLREISQHHALPVVAAPLPAGRWSGTPRSRQEVAWRGTRDGLDGSALEPECSSNDGDETGADDQTPEIASQ